MRRWAVSRSASIWCDLWKTDSALSTVFPRSVARETASPHDACVAAERELGILVERLRSLVDQEEAVLARRKEVIRPGEVVSEDRAARALPLRRADAVTWLRQEGLSQPLAGRRVVVWDAVLTRLVGPQPPVQQPQRQRSRNTDTETPLLASPGRMFG